MITWGNCTSSTTTSAGACDSDCVEEYLTTGLLGWGSEPFIPKVTIRYPLFKSISMPYCSILEFVGKLIAKITFIEALSRGRYV